MDALPSPHVPSLKTRRVAGRSITLPAGERFLAVRPMAEAGRNRFPVSIVPLDQPLATTRHRVGVMGYEAANAFLNAFNSDGPTSFHGRCW